MHNAWHYTMFPLLHNNIYSIKKSYLPISMVRFSHSPLLNTKTLYKTLLQVAGSLKTFFNHFAIILIQFLFMYRNSKFISIPFLLMYRSSEFVIVTLTQEPAKIWSIRHSLNEPTVKLRFQMNREPTTTINNRFYV